MGDTCGTLRSMSIENEPHYRISASELASWLERQDEGSWWSVDGDPLLMGEVDLPCPAAKLADVIRAVGMDLLILAGGDAKGGTVSSADLDRIALTEDDGNRVFAMRWVNSSTDWVLVEDRDAARVGLAYLRRAAGS